MDFSLVMVGMLYLLYALYIFHMFTAVAAINRELKRARPRIHNSWVIDIRD